MTGNAVAAKSRSRRNAESLGLRVDSFFQSRPVERAGSVREMSEKGFRDVGGGSPVMYSVDVRLAYRARVPFLLYTCADPRRGARMQYTLRLHF